MGRQVKPPDFAASRNLLLGITNPADIASARDRHKFQLK
jgi:hypothetical protein